MSQRTPDALVKDGPVLRFGDVTFDAGRRLVLRGARPVHLEPRAYRLLALLLSSRPRALSKAEILEVVWPGTFVTEGSLSALVKDLRKALGEDARSPTYIRTVFGHGYAFEGTVHEVAPPPPPGRHALFWAGSRLELAEGSNVVGREPPAAVVVAHPSVSREHARIDVAGDRAVLEDLGSKNGTQVNGIRVEAPTRLRDGDRLEVGVAMTFRVLAAGDSTETGTAG